MALPHLWYPGSAFFSLMKYDVKCNNWHICANIPLHSSSSPRNFPAAGPCFCSWAHAEAGELAAQVLEKGMCAGALWKALVLTVHLHRDHSHLVGALLLSSLPASCAALTSGLQDCSTSGWLGQGWAGLCRAGAGLCSGRAGLWQGCGRAVVVAGLGRAGQGCGRAVQGCAGLPCSHSRGWKHSKRDPELAHPCRHLWKLRVLCCLLGAASLEEAAWNDVKHHRGLVCSLSTPLPR